MKSPVLKAPSGRPLSAAAAKLRLLKRLRCTLRYEKKAWACGAHLVAGVDEVGRGSLFGCVVAAAVILDPAYRVRGLRDSKLLEPERREILAERIREHAVAWAVAAVDAARIDQINIYPASIAAASILAKVERDRMMCEWDAVFPAYGLASHKGYSTPKHLAALRELGPTPLHRQSFAPVWQNPVPQEAFAFMHEGEDPEEVTAEDLAG